VVDSETLSAGIRQLEALHADAPTSWRISNDLGAANLTAGLESGSLDLLAAIQPLEQARQVPDGHPARFNLGLLYGALGLGQAADDAWDDFLAAGPPAGWHEEGQARQAARRESGSRWTRWPSTAFLGILSEEQAHLSAEERRQLQTALEQFTRARNAYQSRQLQEALSVLERVEAEIDGLDTLLGAWTDYYQLAAWYGSPGLEIAAETAAIRSRHAPDDPVLEAHLLWLEGLEQVDRGRLVAGLEKYRLAIKLLDDNPTEGEELRLRAVASDVLLRMGRVEDAWQQLSSGLALVDNSADPRHLWPLWDQAAHVAEIAGYDLATKHFNEAALQAAHETDTPLDEIETSLRLGHLTQARRWAEGIDDERTRAQAEALVLMTESRTLDVEPIAAMERLTEVIATYRTRRWSVLLPDLLVERARLRLSLGAAEAAVSDLREALSFREATRQAIEQPALRNSFSTIVRSTIEDLLRFHLDTQLDPTLIPAITDLARDASWTADSPLPPTDGTYHQNLRLAPGEALLSATLLDERLIVWTLVNGELEVHDRPFSRRSLAETELRSLYDFIFGPIHDRLPNLDRLYVTLDRELRNLPLAQLPDPAGVPLVEKATALLVVRSAGVLLRDRNIAPVAIDRVVALGASKSDDWRLSPLGEVDDEIANVTALYPNPGDDPTCPLEPSTFRDAGPCVDVLHVATHGLPNEVVPELAHLVLGDEKLYVPEIRTLPLTRAKVVVLSACEGTTTSTEDPTGAFSLAGAFLDAGAQWVIASVRPVDDRAARLFSERFHEELRKAGRPDLALQRTQRYFHRQGVDPVHWAGFQVIYG
jgi:tetratricopeptide (TPR) repeat protein